MHIYLQIIPKKINIYPYIFHTYSLIVYIYLYEGKDWVFVNTFNEDWFVLIVFQLSFQMKADCTTFYYHPFRSTSIIRFPWPESHRKAEIYRRPSALFKEVFYNSVKCAYSGNCCKISPRDKSASNMCITILWNWTLW